MSLTMCLIPSLATSQLFLRHGPLEERSFPLLCNFQNTKLFGIQGKALLSGNFCFCYNTAR
jgi:hypothetical protein